LLFGSIWLKFATDMTWAAALSGGFITFLIPEIIKAVVAGTLGIFLIQRLPAKFLVTR